MPISGDNCHELMIYDVGLDVDWQVVYLADDIAIVVLEICRETTPRTPQWVINACRARFGRYLRAKQGAK